MPSLSRGVLTLLALAALPVVTFPAWAGVTGEITFDVGESRPWCSLAGTADDGVRSSVLADLDGDGASELIVSARTADLVGGTTLSNAGRVYVLTGGVDPAWDTEVLLPDVADEVWEAEADDVNLGDRLIRIPDITGDGRDEVGVCAPDQPSGSITSAGLFAIVSRTGAIGDGSPLSLPTDAWAYMQPPSVSDNENAKLGFWADAGDLDGDSVPDIVVGGPGIDDAESNSGAAYLVLGVSAGDWTAAWDPSDAPPDLTLSGAETGVRLGRHVQILPDLDGDGLDELLVGGFRESACTTSSVNATALYLFYGRAVWSGLSLGDADASFIEPCAADTPDDNAVRVVAAGDLDGDGFADLALSSAYAAVPATGSETGVVRVVYGSAAGLVGEIDLTSADLPTLTGDDAGGLLGKGLTALGDWDGDGIDDLAISAPEASGGAGRAYVVLGGDRWEGTFTAESVSDLIVAGSAGESLGQPLLGGDDIDGDGYADLLMGGSGYAGPEGAASGRVVVLYGGPVADFDTDADGAPAPGRCTVEPQDCDDADPDIHPGATETWYDGIDGDCGGDLALEYDRDGDTWDAVVAGGSDCDDEAAAVHPGVPEGADTDLDGVLEGDGLDNNCDGEVDEGTDRADDDGDGSAEIDGDCDDADATVYPDAPEEGDGASGVGDGVDNDCDGEVDDGMTFIDADGDGFGDVAAGGDDCDDARSSSYPGAAEILNDGVDQDCDGWDATDADVDGHASIETGGDDCDDGDYAVNPGAREAPNDGIDQDCDGVDDLDGDDDGYGLDADCDDEDPTVHEGAPENGVQEENYGNGVDNDCDGVVDEGTLHFDDDGDGYTELPVVEEDREVVGGYGDCDDAEAGVHPGAAEGVFDADAGLLNGDGVDNDCDGAVDEGTDRVDDDGDGATEPVDCDDDDADRGPGAKEIADGRDNNCDGIIDNLAGCGCASGAKSVGWVWALAGLALRRRRNRKKA